MKNFTRLSIFILAIALMGFSQVEAQKFGYINSLELLASMPESKSADSQLEAYQKQLTAEGQAKLKQLETDLGALYKRIEEGTITPKEQALKEAELEQKRQELIKFEQEAQKKLLDKREGLYTPIFDKANTAIKSVAEENGFTMIFDTSVGVLLHAEESDDILALVKKKLSIP